MKVKEKWRKTREKYEQIESSKTREEKIKEMQLYLLFISAIVISLSLSLFLSYHTFSMVFILSPLLILGVVVIYVIARLTQLQARVAERYNLSLN